MTTDISSLIEQYPHMKDPFELYGRWQHFQQEAAELFTQEGLSTSPQEPNAYPRKIATPLFQIFVATFALEEEKFAALARAVGTGEIDFMRLPLDEIPDLSLSLDKEEIATILFLFSRPYFQQVQKISGLDNPHWKDGRCPLCSARSAIASITEGPKRILHCSWCSTSGPYRFMGCPNCGCEATAKLNTLVPEEMPGFRVITCDACRTYVKVAENTVLQEMTVDQMDMASLPLDIVAQEKGFVRRTPNPIGLTRIV